MSKLVTFNVSVTVEVPDDYTGACAMLGEFVSDIDAALVPGAAIDRWETNHVEEYQG